MKAKKSLVLFLISCLCLTLCFALGVGAEDGANEGGMETITLVSLIIGGVVLAVGILGLFLIKEPERTKKSDTGYLKNIVYGFRPDTVRHNPSLYFYLFLFILEGFTF